MEEDNGNQHLPKDLLEKFGLYDPKLDLAGYQYPSLDLLSESVRPALTQVIQAHADYKLPLWLSTGDRPVLRELYHHPNVIVAGTIASGKTQFIYNQLISWLYTRHPAEIKFVICRSKPVDYNSMAKIERHFLAKSLGLDPPIAGYQQVPSAINGLNIECDLRMDLFRVAGVKTIGDYNHLFITRQLNPEEGHRYLPDIVCILDDISTFLNKETTDALIRLTQQNLYTGIYVIAVTSQIASRDISPQLRANFSVRIAMRLMSQNESRRILDRVGAEKLNQAGELLYEEGEKLRKGIQPLIAYPDILALADFIGRQRGYPSAWLLPEFVDPNEVKVDPFDFEDSDSMFEEAARLVVMHQQGSTSLIQRKLKLGYNRAGRIMDQLEAAGVVGPFEGSAAREVLFPDEYSLEQFLDSVNESVRWRDRGLQFDRHLTSQAKESKEKTSKKPKNRKKSIQKKESFLSADAPTSKPMEGQKSNPSDLQKTHRSNGWIIWLFILFFAVIIYLIGGWKALLDWVTM